MDEIGRSDEELFRSDRHGKSPADDLKQWVMAFLLLSHVPGVLRTEARGL